jgi:cytochrome P450
LCLRESLRLSPPFWQTPRTASEDIVVNGHAIPAHSFVMVCL